MESISIDGGEDGELISVGLVELSNIFVKQSELLLWSNVIWESLADMKHQLKYKHDEATHKNPSSLSHVCPPQPPGKGHRKGMTFTL